MNCWAILGIERTADTSVIRKAYKQQLLIYHPEDDPTDYQKVREAYAAAMNEAKRQERSARANTDEAAYERVGAQAEAAADADERVTQRLRIVDVADPREDDSEQAGGREDEERSTVIRRHFAPRIHDATQIENDFMKRLARLYKDQNQRNNPEAWTELLSDDVLWDIQSKLAINEKMLKFFSKQHDLDDETWKIIETHTGLFDKITKSPDQYSAYFVDTYTLATQQIAVPSRQKLAAASEVQIIKKPSVIWWKYCFRFPVSWIILAIIGNAVAVPGYLISVLVRGVLFVRRRNWKIIMWEYTFTHVNSWGKRYDFKYIDIIKIVQNHNIVIVYLKNKKIRIKAHQVQNLGQLLAKMSRYGRTDGNAIIVRES